MNEVFKAKKTGEEVVPTIHTIEEGKVGKVAETTEVLVDAQIKPLSVETQIAIMNMEEVSDDAPWSEQVVNALEELGFKHKLIEGNRMHITQDTQDRTSLILTQSEAREFLLNALHVLDEQKEALRE